MNEYKDDDPVVVENLGERKGIGKYVFQKDPNYEFPKTILPYSIAIRIIESNKRDQEAADKRRAEMIAENKRRVEVNKIVAPDKRLAILVIPETLSLENVRFGIPLRKSDPVEIGEKVDGRRKKVTD